jgi:hypothetical protein
LEYGEEEEYGEEKRFRHAVPARVPKSVDFDSGEGDEGAAGVPEPDIPPEPPKKTGRASKIAEAAHKAVEKAVAAAEKPESPFEPVQKETEPVQKATAELFSVAEADTEAWFCLQLNKLIEGAKIDKNLYFEWLRHQGIKHRAADKHPEAVVMTAVDLKPSDLEDAVEGWSVNFQLFNEWRKARGQK